MGVLVTDLTTKRHHEKLSAALHERKLAQEQQEKELRDTKLLQDISAQLIQPQDADALYRQILEAGVKLMHAEKGTLQLFAPATAELQLIASYGIDPELHNAFRIVTSESGTSCAQALMSGKRSIITDFSASEYRGSAAAAAHIAAGVMAAQTTPLMTREGVLLGMMSTHWGKSWQPDERALRMTDILARQTADLIERMQAEESLRQSEARLEMELADTKLLQSVSAQIIHEENIDTLYQKLVDAAVAVMQSDFGSLQMYYPERGELRLLAASGLNQAAKDFWEWVRADNGSTCSVAMRTGQRFICSDLHSSDYVKGTPDHAMFVAGGVRAAQSTPLYSRSGKLLGMISTHWLRHHTPSDRDLRLLDILARQAADLIERKVAEEALQQTKVALTEADRRKDEFLATLAHELRNPLAPIRNGLHLLRASLPRNKMEELRDMMDRQVTHLVRLIDDLLDVSRVSQGKIDLRRQRITLQQAVQAAAEASRPLIEGSRHTLLLNLPEQPLWLDADLTRLAQVVGNLLNNAAKYTPEGGHIAVSVRKKGKYAVLSVADNGVGIPTDMLPKVFDLFTQIGNNLERSQGGLGIGLALVKQLVEMHEGHIDAKSAGMDQGSTFTVRLPLASVGETGRSTSDSVDVPDVAPPVALRVLVVDDNIPAAQTTGWMLESLGHEAELAYGAADALTTARAFRPEAILLDIGLPGMNGYDLCRQLRKEPLFKEILIIAQTGWGQERDRQLAKEAGFDHHLVKPVNFETVTELLAKWGSAQAARSVGGVVPGVESTGLSQINDTGLPSS
ncbi:MAG: ATP-binding protein [Pseudomonadota bacterium]